MKVVLFGATGMVGQGVLRECLLDSDVESVLAVVRNASLPQHDFGSKPNFVAIFTLPRKGARASPTSSSFVNGP